jgi:hypothetical protein
VCVCVRERFKQRGAYPFPAGVPAGSGAGGRLDEPRPHLAAGLLHPLPQEPHRRICHTEFETAISGTELKRRLTRPHLAAGCSEGFDSRVAWEVRWADLGRWHEQTGWA